VLVDGTRVFACRTSVARVEGKAIQTIEGLAAGDQLHPVQQGFWECHGLQCGYCTPGMIMTSVQILERNPDPNVEEIRHGLEGNLCRCTGYQHIVEAVQHAARQMKRGAAAGD
jgi:carbon-monoxide dehydrogenase small subunit